MEITTGTWSKITNTTYNFSADGDMQTFTLNADNSLSFSITDNGESVIYSYQKQ